VRNASGAELRQRLCCGLDAIYPGLATKYDLVLYPFFLDGVVEDRAFNQADGLHPTAAGVDRIVERILPKVEELVARVKTKRGS